MQEISVTNQSVLIPRLSIETAEDAIAKVNGWLHTEIGLALNVDAAQFDAKTFCWHLPVNLAYGSTGRLGTVGDIYLHAATGEFVGAPTVAELQQRAEELAEAHGIATGTKF